MHSSHMFFDTLGSAEFFMTNFAAINFFIRSVLHPKMDIQDETIFIRFPANLEKIGKFLVRLGLSISSVNNSLIRNCFSGEAN